MAVAEWPSKKICHCLVSTSASSEQRVWADLPDSLLHLIIALLSSFHDLLAFSGTCHSWRAAVFSFPSSIYAFVFPPLHLKAGLRKVNRDCGTWYNLLSNYEWRLCDRSSYRWHVPRHSIYIGPERRTAGCHGNSVSDNGSSNSVCSSVGGDLALCSLNAAISENQLH